MKVYKNILEIKSRGQKQLAVLIDPDAVSISKVHKLVDKALAAQVDCFYIGGSLVNYTRMESVLTLLKEISPIPVIIFPGNTNQLSNNADAVLFLSLISGRNPDLLIGKHVESIPFLKQSNIEVISTGYILIDGGNNSSVAYMSNTTPIPASKTDIITSTALAGEYLGMKMIYLEAGSGALLPVSTTTIRKVSKEISVPLIVGGGIKTPEKAAAAAQAGADIIVIGNILEKEPELVMDLSLAIHNTKTVMT